MIEQVERNQVTTTRLKEWQTLCAMCAKWGEGAPYQCHLRQDMDAFAKRFALGLACVECRYYRSKRE